MKEKKNIRTRQNKPDVADDKSEPVSGGNGADLFNWLDVRELIRRPLEADAGLY